MRHNKKFNHLGRTASHRSAMLSNMAGRRARGASDVRVSDCCKG